MRKVFYLAVVVLGMSFTACKKCATCTSTTPSSTGQDSTITGEFCESGQIYKNTLYQYNESGWDCVEN